MSWATAPTVPERKHGPGWSTSATATALKPGAGWFALLEKVAPLNGTGALLASARPRIAASATLNGDGAVLPALALRNYRAADLSGIGQHVGGLFETRSITALLTGSGALDYTINDGLSAILQVGYAALFSGGGVLVPDTVGGVGVQDGLGASVIGRQAISAFFTGVGELLSLFGETNIALGELLGDGELTADLSQVYDLLIDLLGDGDLEAAVETHIDTAKPHFDGSGTLNATTRALYRRLADLLGRGDLTAQLVIAYLTSAALSGAGSLSTQAFTRYLTTVDFSSAGAFTATLVANYLRAANLSGTGALTAGLMQSYPLPGTFLGGGGLAGDDIHPADVIDGLSATAVGRYLIPSIFASEGQLVANLGVIQIALADLIGSGALTAANPKQIYPLLAQMTAQGSLSATATRGAQQIADLLGTGTVSATAMEHYFSSLGVSGAGALVALFAVSYTPASGGVGTVTALVSQRYSLPTYAVVAGDFETDSAWNPGLTVGAQTTEQAHGGVKSHKLTGTADYVQFVFTNDGAGGYIFPPTAPGRRIFTSVWLRRHTANTNVGTVYLRMLPRNAAAQAIAVFQTSIPAAAIPSTDWTQISVSAVMPDEAATFYTDVLLDPNVPAGDVFYVDDVQVDDGTGLGAYGNGTLSASVNGYVPVPRASAFSGNGALTASVVAIPRAFVTAAFSGSGSMSASASFPVVAEVTTQLTTVGAYTYTIPWWANFVDEIFLGAGGGGAGGSGATAATGNGALAGTYSNRTLIRGSNLPWGTTSLTGNIGDGGAPGSQNNAGVGGSPATRNAISGGDIARQGNGGGGGAGTNGDPGRAAGNLDFNGKTYVGGAQANSGGNPGAAGNPPGGGGAGGAGGIFNTGKAGGKGGRGQAWFRAYQ